MKKKISIVVIIILIAIQFIPVNKNEEVGENKMDFLVQNNISTDDPIHLILKTSCYDCHSNSTNYPWYNKIAPVSWYLGNHVKNAKNKLNFSEWGAYDVAKQAHKVEEVISYVEKDWMPIVTYKVLHPEAKLDEEKKSLLLNYFKSL